MDLTFLTIGDVFDATKVRHIELILWVTFFVMTAIFFVGEGRVIIRAAVANENQAIPLILRSI